MKKEIFLKRYWKILTTSDVKISVGLIFVFGYADTPAILFGGFAVTVFIFYMLIDRFNKSA